MYCNAMKSTRFLQEATKEAELRARLADGQMEMELAVEDQQLQKTAALKQQEMATQDIQTKCRELEEVRLKFYVLLFGCYFFSVD
jgi:hypothetical protein